MGFFFLHSYLRKTLGKYVLRILGFLTVTFWLTCKAPVTESANLFTDDNIELVTFEKETFLHVVLHFFTVNKV